MKKGLIISCGILIALSAYGLIESSRLERTMKMGIGIGFLPFVMSLAIGGLSIALLVGILRGRVEISDKPIFQPDGRSRVFVVVAFLMGYLFLIEWLGYVASTFIYMAATIIFLRRERIVNAVLMSTVLTAFLFAIFRLWLKSPLPTGLLGI
ncbi:MAG: tripartite tricarboxylate transporter TctB family protein [Deltaproteobacteria bacterium]|nr:tripartite tricarboxylate transporter TctB family protein [Deltaproteobacteria bacterium]